MSIAGLKAVVARFASNEAGALSILFAFLLIPILLLVGTAIDYSRALETKATLRNALDAAALAGVAKLVREGGSKDEVDAIVNATFQNAITLSGGSGISIKGLTITQDPDTGAVSVDATLTMPTTFMQLAGFADIDIANKSVARLSDKDIEVALMLDVTGSMAGSKISDLKAAAKELIDVLIPTTAHSYQNEVRIAIIPYSQGVNVASYASAVTDGVSNKCATERSVKSFTDAFYTQAPIGDGSTGCPGVEFLPLTDSNATLTTKINSLATTGYTAGHTGIAWSWYTLSPKWSPLWPAGSDPVAYDDDETVKIAILMTDGEFNTAYDYNEASGKYKESRGNAKSKSEQRAKKLCKNMKKAGIEIYSVTFQLYSTSAKAMMEECASTSGKYFDASNGTALRNAFKSIAADISQMRLSE
ncbi:vWA domain-containing protein [Rhodobium gokarnense]|uniref:Flp pilus assembly protein TadG n=1 Tax=Rhodobium gokarnense TaxID=364296 RepID=A0ABT3HIN9_9HYPH|nr:TadE/TadG family type IV pilus assembly protein [Rhodobium gokarnense]MCW2310247.1 Flp pilus assembly protein TadG [Rhodobium gokarnense]